MYKEHLWIGDTKVSIEYTIEPPEPDVGIKGGIVLEDLEVIGVRFSGLGDKVSQEELEAEAVKQLKEDLGL